MIRKIILTLSLPIFAVTVAFGEKAVPDNDEILKAIIDSSSPYYYPSLMLRYEAGDTTLTLDDYHHLYYGFAWQPEYKPLEPQPERDAVLMAFEGLLSNDRGVTVDEAAQKLIWECTTLFEIDPFSPSNLNYLTFAYGFLGDTINEKINADRMRKVLKTIESSGTGRRESEPWHIIFFPHANDYLGSRGETIQRRTVRSRTVEYVHIQRMGRENIKGHYFNFERMYWKKPENPPERRSQGFEINRMKVGGRKGKYNPTK